MFRGYPRVDLAQVSELNMDYEKSNEEGAVKGVDLPEVNRVVVSMSVALQIARCARHCTSTLVVNGSLCGLQIGSTLEITYAYPHRKVEYKDDKIGKEKEKTNDDDDLMELAKPLKELFAIEDIDINIVGQFTAGSLCSKALVDMQGTFDKLLKCQGSGAAGVLLVYDPLAAAELGKINLTAYAITQEFTDVIQELTTKVDTTKIRESLLLHPKFTELLSASNVHETGILRQIPVSIHCDALHKMMLHQIEGSELPTSREVVNSVIFDQYLEELLFKTTMTCDQFKKSCSDKMKPQNHWNSKEPNQKLMQLLQLDQLKRQTTQLVGLCDSILLHAALTSKLME